MPQTNCHQHSTQLPPPLTPAPHLPTHPRTHTAPQASHCITNSSTTTPENMPNVYRQRGKDLTTSGWHLCTHTLTREYLSQKKDLPKQLYTLITQLHNKDKAHVSLTREGKSCSSLSSLGFYHFCQRSHSVDSVSQKNLPVNPTDKTKRDNENVPFVFEEPPRS